MNVSFSSSNNATPTFLRLPPGAAPNDVTEEKLPFDMCEDIEGFLKTMGMCVKAQVVGKFFSSSERVNTYTPRSRNPVNRFHQLEEFARLQRSATEMFAHMSRASLPAIRSISQDALLAISRNMEERLSMLDYTYTMMKAHQKVPNYSAPFPICACILIMPLSPNAVILTPLPFTVVPPSTPSTQDTLTPCSRRRWVRYWLLTAG